MANCGSHDSLLGALSARVDRAGIASIRPCQYFAVWSSHSIQGWIRSFSVGLTTASNL